MRLDQQTYDLKARMTELLELYPELSDDETLKADTFEGLGLHECLAKLVEIVEEAETMSEAIKLRIDEMLKRKARFETRRENVRSIIQSIMEIADIHKLHLPAATLSISFRKPSPVVADETLVPDEYCKFVKKPVMAKIKEAFENNQDVPGITLSNGRNVLYIRTS